MAQIGQIIGGKYEILRLIDKGGMSRVYLARDVSMSKEWVVKEILKMINDRDNSLSVNSAISEVDIVKELDHPSIVRVVDILNDSKAVYIVEDYVHGHSLKEMADSGEYIDETMLADWMLQLTEVLAYLHSRNPAVIYRDIKPENIILTESGHIKLIDFGISRRYKPGQARDTQYLGTERFAAPEQYEEYGMQTDARTDIYGLGKTIEYLSGYCRKISSEFDEMIRTCIKNNPDDRFQSAEQLHDQLSIMLEQRQRKHKKNKISLLRILVTVLAVICIFLAASVSLLRMTGSKSQLDKIGEVIEEIKIDGLFSAEEEEELLSIIRPNLSELKEQEGFEKIAFEVGKLYWYYYDYGSDSTIGIIEAVPWFELSQDYSEMAAVFEKIGIFYRDINKRIQESSDEGMYRECFIQLSKLCADITDNTAELVSLEVYKLIIHSIETYARKFCIDGVELENISDLYGRVAQNVRKMRTTSTQADSLKMQIISRLDAAADAISFAYSNGSGETAK